MDMKNNWREFPTEHPTETGEYLCRGIGGLNNRLHHYVCLWIGECDDRQIANHFFYGGNVFNEIPSGKFEFIKCSEL